MYICSKYNIERNLLDTTHSNYLQESYLNQPLVL